MSWEDKLLVLEDRLYWRVGWKNIACLGEMILEDMLSVLENRLYWGIGWKKIACLREMILEDMLPVSDKIVCLVWVV